MVIISQATNYFKPFFFETVIQVNLTIILVLATMFLAISQSLPTTSYVKMLDVWFIMVLLVPFAYVLIHTYMDLLRDYKDKNENTEEEDNYQFADIDKNFSANTSPILRLDKINKITNPSKQDLNLVSVNEKTQVNARKKFYEEIDALGKDYKLKICLKLTKLIVPAIIVCLMTLYWLIGIAKYYQVV